MAQQPLSLVGCDVVPDPSPDHLYSFRILHNGEELAKLEVPRAQPGRGVRGSPASPGDPVVPYFCFLCPPEMACIFENFPFPS